MSASRGTLTRFLELPPAQVASQQSRPVETGRRLRPSRPAARWSRPDRWPGRAFNTCAFLCVLRMHGRVFLQATDGSEHLGLLLPNRSKHELRYQEALVQDAAMASCGAGRREEAPAEQNRTRHMHTNSLGQHHPRGTADGNIRAPGVPGAYPLSTPHTMLSASGRLAEWRT